LREEHRLRVFENRVLRIILGHKVDVVTGEWKKLHNDLYSSNIVRVIILRIKRWARHVACMGKRRGVYRIMVGKLRKETTW
jgi:hypothetical protein